MRRHTAEIIAWKFDNAPGMQTRNGKIFGWPSNLNGGVSPTELELDQWDADMTALDFKPPPTVDEILEALLEQVDAPPGSALEDVKTRRGPRP